MSADPQTYAGSTEVRVVGHRMPHDDPMAPQPDFSAPAKANARPAPNGKGADPKRDVASPPDPHLLRQLVDWEYRSMVIRQLQITVEWQSIEWLDLAACRNEAAATHTACCRCPVRAPCLAAAITIDDSATWRGGVTRDERIALWEELESAFFRLRDLDFTQLDRLVDGRSAD